MEEIKIVLTPEEVQNLLDCIDIIPSNHYICIGKDEFDNNFIQDLGKDGIDNISYFKL